MKRPDRQRRHAIAILVLVGIFTSLLLTLPIARAWAQQGGVSQRAQSVLNGVLWQGMPTRLGVFTNPTTPRVLFAPDGAVHLIWEDRGVIYHAWRAADGTWHQPRRVFRGLTPSLVVDARGRVHMVFAQDVVGNFEIYYTMFDGFGWTLPRNVSHTPGHSYSPYISIGADGSLHVVWNERVGHGDLIYHAVLDGATWVDFPIPGAWGKAPIIHLIDRVAHVLWQGPDLTSAYDIYHVQGMGMTWQLPQNLSDTPWQQSVGLDAVVDARGWIHAVWLESSSQGTKATYTYGNGTTWRWPETVSPGVADDVGIATSERGTYVHVLWADPRGWWVRWRGIMSPRWSPAVQMTYANGDAMTLRFAPQNDERMRALWRLDTPTGAEMWYGEASTPVKQRLFFAHLGRNAPTR